MRLCHHVPNASAARCLQPRRCAVRRHGFTPIGYFPLSESCWLENYYRPLQARFPALLEHYEHSDTARACVEAEEYEIALYERHKAHVSYGFYIARNV